MSNPLPEPLLAAGLAAVVLSAYSIGPTLRARNEERSCSASWREMSRPHVNIEGGNILYPDSSPIMSGPIPAEDEWMSSCLAGRRKYRIGRFGHWKPGDTPNAAILADARAGCARAWGDSPRTGNFQEFVAGCVERNLSD